MPITFGSVGDIISVCLIVKDLVDALHEAHGSSAEYQSLTHELRLLERSLLHVDMLARVCANSIELNALNATIKQTVDACKESVRLISERIAKFRKSLAKEGSGNSFKDSARKIQWHILKKDEVVRFRDEVMRHCSAINMLISTASV